MNLFRRAWDWFTVKEALPTTGQPGSLYASPMNEEGEWKELGYTTDEGMTMEGKSVGWTAKALHDAMSYVNERYGNLTLAGQVNPSPTPQEYTVLVEDGAYGRYYFPRAILDETHLWWNTTVEAKPRTAIKVTLNRKVEWGEREDLIQKYGFEFVDNAEGNAGFVEFWATSGSTPSRKLFKRVRGILSQNFVNLYPKSVFTDSEAEL